MFNYMKRPTKILLNPTTTQKIAHVSVYTTISGCVVATILGCVRYHVVC